MSVKIKVLTLNCWGVHVLTVKKYERMTAIAAELSKGEHDVVLLQEIWMQSDYKLLCAKILPLMPFTHYFHSGVIGSGLCIFSKHPIVETQGIPYSLNGYPHRFYHGDWFGRKGVGLAKIIIHGINVNFYVTHLHAMYEGSMREYHGHRVSQAFEFSQHIKNTSECCDVAVVCGDFNYTPDSIGYKVIRYNGNLLDSLYTQRAAMENEKEADTCDRLDNPFTKSTSAAPGGRLDYILYRYNAGYQVDCERCYLTMRRVPGEQYHYSDHEGVAAELIVRKNTTGMGVVRDTAEVQKHLTDCLPILEAAERKANSDRVFYVLSMFACLVVLVFTSDLTQSWTLGGATVGLLRTLLSFAIAFFIWMTLINAPVEFSALTATKNDINNLLRAQKNNVSLM